MTTSGPQNRVFLRIPVSMPADVYADGRLVQRTRLVDLSTGGLSFMVGPTDPLPDELQIQFKLKALARPMKMTLGVKNRVALPAGVRIGCIFLQASEADKKQLEHYVRDFTGLSLPEQAVNIAAFVCAVDAALRLCLYNLAVYYSATDFGQGTLTPAFSGGSRSALLIYIISAVLAFMLSTRSIVKKGKLGFLSSLLALIFPLNFLVAKNAAAWEQGLWALNDLPMNVLLVSQLALMLYVGAAIITGLLFLNKIALTLGVIRQEITVLKDGFSHLHALRKGP